MNRKREFRTSTTGVTSKADGNTLSGYIALFNTMSEDLGGFREQLAPGCFSSSLASEIRALVNHNTSACIGNTKSGTLRLKQDDTGLAYEIDLPDTTSARDLKVSVERGDVTGCSFGFFCVDADWDTKGGTQVRTVNDLELFEVSVGVTFPAYTDTTSQLRSLFPDGVPAQRDGADGDGNDNGCNCECPECVANDCIDCSDPDCDDSECLANQERSIRDRMTIAQLPVNL